MPSPNTNTLVTPDELRHPRSYPEFVEWMDDKEKVLRTSSMTQATARLASGPQKTFRDEVFAFRVFGDQVLAGTDAKVTFPADNGPYDVLVADFPNRGDEQGIQVVNAVDGYSDRLRRELLSMEGHAPGAGPIKKVGPNKKADYAIKAIGTTISRDEVVAEQCFLIIRAIALKRDKKYPLGTWLIVSFDDALVFEDEDYSHISEVASEAANGSEFQRVYLVGGSHNGVCQLIWNQDQAHTSS